MARLKAEQIARNKAGVKSTPQRGKTDLQKRKAGRDRDERGAAAVAKANKSLDRNKREIESAGPGKARDALQRRLNAAGTENQTTDSNN
jgi:hypothetical protein